MHDRWDHNQSKRSIEDLKERYYNICAILAKVCQMNVLSASFFSLSHFASFTAVLKSCCFGSPELCLHGQTGPLL